MTEFEMALEQCLLDLEGEGGASNLDECLSRYPQHAQQLEPVLVTHMYFERVGEARPSAAFKARVRAKLTQQMQAYPRRRSSRFNFAFMRLAANLAILLLALLAAGTVYAQSALPGEPFYEWKLASENTWRAVSSDPVRTDLAIAERRMNELIAVRNDSVLQPQALNAYLEAAARLRSETNAENEALILQALHSQVEALTESGITVPEIINEGLLPELNETLPTLVSPIATLLPLTEFPQVDPTSAVSAEATPIPSEVTERYPTPLPNIVPTVQAIPSLIPTVQVPPIILPTIQLPDIVPTIQVPPLIP
jgi:hypothetical protein